MSEPRITVDLPVDIRPEVLAGRGLGIRTHFWQGRVECTTCGYGRDVNVRSVVEIPCERDAPDVALECPECRNTTLSPVEADYE